MAKNNNPKGIPHSLQTFGSKVTLRDISGNVNSKGPELAPPSLILPGLVGLNLVVVLVSAEKETPGFFGVSSFVAFLVVAVFVLGAAAVVGFPSSFGSFLDFAAFVVVFSVMALWMVAN